MSAVQPVPAGEILRHGAYLGVAIPAGGPGTLAGAPVADLAARLGLENEFTARDGHPRNAVAFLRRVEAAAGELPDRGLLKSAGLLHVASDTADVVDEFCAALPQLLQPPALSCVLRGVIRPPQYTGAAMHEFAYAHQVRQQPGAVMRHAFLLPLKKAAAWWEKSWMERHTYFLPRFDERDRMLSQGHALAAASGVACLMRRTYGSPIVPAPEDRYDFVTYFECADADLSTFHSVCANLRDVAQNPEWRYVREGPTWHGERKPTWAELFQ